MGPENFRLSKCSGRDAFRCSTTGTGEDSARGSTTGREVCKTVLNTPKNHIRRPLRANFLSHNYSFFYGAVSELTYDRPAAVCFAWERGTEELRQKQQQQQKHDRVIYLLMADDDHWHGGDAAGRKEEDDGAKIFQQEDPII